MQGRSIEYENVESMPGLRLVRRIATPVLPFGGTWTVDLEPRGVGCLVGLREDGEVYKPIFRVVSRYILGHRATIAAFLTVLGRSCGEG